mmetsp:Transcript_27372/g.63877  ORF Transcript_27372/g.63877 Transcript_27372/m.63877 type:complete len:109 (+) Transcript_27372:2124-2450(+)
MSNGGGALDARKEDLLAAGDMALDIGMAPPMGSNALMPTSTRDGSAKPVGELGGTGDKASSGTIGDGLPHGAAAIRPRNRPLPAVLGCLCCEVCLRPRELARGCLIFG